MVVTEGKQNSSNFIFWVYPTSTFRWNSFSAREKRKNLTDRCTIWCRNGDFSRGDAESKVLETCMSSFLDAQTSSYFLPNLWAQSGAVLLLRLHSFKENNISWLGPLGWNKRLFIQKEKKKKVKESSWQKRLRQRQRQRQPDGRTEKLIPFSFLFFFQQPSEVCCLLLLLLLLPNLSLTLTEMPSGPFVLSANSAARIMASLGVPASFAFFKLATITTRMFSSSGMGINFCRPATTCRSSPFPTSILQTYSLSELGCFSTLTTLAT